VVDRWDKQWDGEWGMGRGGHDGNVIHNGFMSSRGG